MGITKTTKARVRVIKDPPMPSTLGKDRIREAIQEVMRERFSTERVPNANPRTAGRPVKPEPSMPRKRNRARFASATAGSKKR